MFYFIIRMLIDKKMKYEEYEMYQWRAKVSGLDVVRTESSSWILFFSSNLLNH